MAGPLIAAIAGTSRSYIARGMRWIWRMYLARIWAGVPPNIPTASRMSFRLPPAQNAAPAPVMTRQEISVIRVDSGQRVYQTVYQCISQRIAGVRIVQREDHRPVETFLQKGVVHGCSPEAKGASVCAARALNMSAIHHEGPQPTFGVCECGASDLLVPVLLATGIVVRREGPGGEAMQ